MPAAGTVSVRRQKPERTAKMVSKSLTVTNPQGLHMRPASELAGAMGKYKSEICIIHNGNKINAKSVMNLIAACIKCGSDIVIECDGEDEQAMLDEAAAMIESGFGE
jgi:phosphocarrier protein HPr